MKPTPLRCIHFTFLALGTQCAVCCVCMVHSLFHLFNSSLFYCFVWHTQKHYCSCLLTCRQEIYAIMCARTHTAFIQHHIAMILLCDGKSIHTLVCHCTPKIWHRQHLLYTEKQSRPEHHSCNWKRKTQRKNKQTYPCMIS